jgi:hypothetical protein
VGLLRPLLSSRGRGGQPPNHALQPTGRAPPLNARSFGRPGGTDTEIGCLPRVWNGIRFNSVVACLLLVTAGRARGGTVCTTEGILDRQEVTLLIDGQEPFELMFRDSARIRVTFSARSAPWIEADVPQISVQAPGRVVHYLRRDGSYDNNMLFVRSEVALSDLQYGNGAIRTSIPLDEGLVVRGVEVPCEDLRAGGQAGPAVHQDRAVSDGHEMARARRGSLVLHDLPGKMGSQLRLEPAAVTFFVVGRKRGWVKLAWDGPAGDLQGWAPSTAVRTVTTFSLTAQSAIGCCGVNPLAKGATKRSGSLRAGASIHASAGGKRWGLVKSMIDGVELEDIPGSEWLRMLSNPTLREDACDPTHSWVLRSDVEHLGAAHRPVSGGVAERRVAAAGAAPRR